MNNAALYIRMGLIRMDCSNSNSAPTNAMLCSLSRHNAACSKVLAIIDTFLEYPSTLPLPFSLNLKSEVEVWRIEMMHSDIAVFAS